MSKCIMCGSYAINHRLHGRDGSDPDLCDVCFWRKRAAEAVEVEREACAKVCGDRVGTHPAHMYSVQFDNESQDCADAIRARSES